MRVRCLSSSYDVSGNRYVHGDEFELRDDLAQLGIAAGCAEAVESVSELNISEPEPVAAGNETPNAKKPLKKQTRHK